ncbi:MAG: FAD-binding protein [Gemmatimonadetes bacterium]|jgi:succinate dehydrogenase / fumarate reductase, flavoprotein subunit|nr:FAD-binding protein [Gemmatimonadota bacterium]
MAIDIPQGILDALTRVKMPGGVCIRERDDIVEINDFKCPVHKVEALVLGSGAAGLRAAVELKREAVDVLVCSTGLFSGTSACSGSDKQTLHTAGTSNRGDDFTKLANDIGSGGGMDKDTAYIEAVGSIGAFAGLQYMGLPLPQDRFGAVLRYQTDHDDVGRATSCGPRTSRLMTKVLCEEAIRLDIPFLKQTTGIRILADDNEVKGVIAIERDRDTNEFGLLVILCDKLVLATGGPGELYRDSVYPKHCFGSLGMAIEAGIKVCNLTESQFGIGTRRTEFPWNLSGTYVQVIPYIYSVDEHGKEHNFLADFYRTTRELASNVFRKGYQWPFHATRMVDYKSSLVDLAIFIESRKGHTVLMDFNRNPEAVPGDEPFSLDRLDPDVRAYLENNDALREMPIDRLLRMNPLAIELYRQHKHDIATTPLPFNVSNQHMNGGVDVDIWAQSSLKGCYAIGEVSGTHGVTRPGGAALNAGQVFGMRCAKHIASCKGTFPDSSSIGDTVRKSIENAIDEIGANLDNEDGMQVEDIEIDVQDRMSDHAGFICNVDEIADALKAAIALNQSIRDHGMNIDAPNKITSYFNWRHTALSSEAVLRALNHYAINGGGSRGARAMCSANGTVVPVARNVDLEAFRFIEEQEKDKTVKVVLEYKNDGFEISERSLREMENPRSIFFEKNWGNYLTGAIYDDDFEHK